MNNIDNVNYRNSGKQDQRNGADQIPEAPSWPFPAVCGNQEVSRIEAPSWKGDIKHRFGVRLKQLRKERGYTQMRLAMEADCDRSYLSDVERGVKEMALTKLNNLALAFGMPLKDLFEGL